MVVSDTASLQGAVASEHCDVRCNAVEPGQDDVSGQPFDSVASGALCGNPVQNLRLDLARVLGRAGRSAEAVAAYRALPLAVMEGDPLACMGYAASLVAVGDAHGAESALGAALLRSSPSPQACPRALCQVLWASLQC